MERIVGISCETAIHLWFLFVYIYFYYIYIHIYIRQWDLNANRTVDLSALSLVTILRITVFGRNMQLAFELNTILYFDWTFSSSLITYLLHGAVLLEKLTGLQLVKKFPALHGTRRFITALTSVRHLSLSWANPIQSIYPHPTSWRSILILPTHLRLGLPSGLFPSGFATKTLYTPLSSPIRVTCPAHLI